MKEQPHVTKSPVDQHVQQLLNGSIDGDLSAAEQKELDHLLTSSQSVHDLNNELRTVAHLLDDLPEIEPPQYLQDTIERQVGLPVQSGKAADRDRFLGAWLNANWLRTGLALAAGVVLTVGVYEMGFEPIPAGDTANMTGTIAPNGPANNQGVLLDRIQLDSEVLNGRVELRVNDDLFTLDVKLKSDIPSEVVVNFGGRGLEFDSVNSRQNTADTVSILGGSIRLASNGEQHYLLNLRRVPGTESVAAPLELDVFANSQLIKQGILSFSQQ